MRGHTVQFTAHNGGYFAFVNGRPVGWMRRELQNHPGYRPGAFTPDGWACWRIYRRGEPFAQGDSRRAAAIGAWNALHGKGVAA